MFSLEIQIGYSILRTNEIVKPKYNLKWEPRWDVRSLTFEELTDHVVETQDKTVSMSLFESQIGYTIFNHDVVGTQNKTVNQSYNEAQIVIVSRR